jgi:hypothetical protein
MNLLDPENLATGTPRQKEAHKVLQDLGLCAQLARLANSAPAMQQRWSAEADFTLDHVVLNGAPTVLCRWMARWMTAPAMPIEVRAQTASVFTQEPIVQMLVEARLLTFAPSEAREKIRALKRSGKSTIEAFAESFELAGDAAEELMKISRLADREILSLTHRLRFQLH